MRLVTKLWVSILGTVNRVLGNRFAALTFVTNCRLCLWRRQECEHSIAIHAYIIHKRKNEVH